MVEEKKEEKRELKVLIVEDTEEHLILLTEALQRSNLKARAFAVRDGEEALDFLYNQGKFASKNDYPRPDIVLLDLRLPKVNGIAVLERIRRDENLRELPVVVLTASKREEDIVKAVEYDVKSYLLKSTTFTIRKTGDMDKILDLILSFA